MSTSSAFSSANESLARLRKSFEQWRVPACILEDLTDRNIVVTFAKDAMVFAEGSTPDLFGCVLSGYVRVYCAVGDGNRTLMRIAGPGELLGYADYIDEKGRRARLFEAQGLTKCNVALLSRDHIARMLRTLDPNALVDLIESLNTFWSLTTRWFALLLGLPFQQRIEMVFRDLGERVGVRDTRGVLLLPDICHEDLAEMIGCSRPMITRLVHDMEEVGKLVRRGKQYILLGDWNLEATINGSGPTEGPKPPKRSADGRAASGTASRPPSAVSHHLADRSAAK
jgi:CRP/FNR family cyclic AMP-dependent transcriptional regulator